MTVADRLVELRAEIDALELIACANCRHPYMIHDKPRRDQPDVGKCLHPRWRKEPPCKCRKFVDPSEVLV